MGDGARQGCVCTAHQDHRATAWLGVEGISGDLLVQKKQVLVPAGSVFSWLPAAQMTQDINRTTEIMAGQFAVGGQFSHMNFARRPRPRI